MESFPGGEPRAVSGTGCPAHPHAARRYERGLRVRLIGSLQIQVSRPWSRAAGSLLDELYPRTRAILARLSAISDAPFGGGPLPLTSGSPAPNNSPTAPRRTTSSRYSWLNLTPRTDPRAELRHPCAPRPPNDPPATQLALPSRSQLALFFRSVSSLAGSRISSFWRPCWFIAARHNPR